MSKLKINAVFNDDAPADIGEIDGWECLDLLRLPDKKFVTLSLTLDIGMQGVIGTNLFWLEVCTTRYAKEKGTNSKRKYVLLVEEFDWLKIKPMVAERVYACERGDWDKSVAEMRRHFMWEYETKQTSRKKLQPLPGDFFQEPDWDEVERTLSDRDVSPKKH